MMPVAEASISSVISHYIDPPATLSMPAYTQRVSETDKSGRIIIGGVPQVIMGANSYRKAFIVANPVTAREVLQVSLGDTGHYVDLLPGAVWESGSAVWPGNIYVRAATAAHQFTAYEGS